MALAEGVNGVHGGQPALPNDAHPVAGPLHLLKHMAGEQYGFAPLLFLPEQFDEAVLHQRVQAAGGFVQNQNPRVVGKCGDDSQLLPHTLAHFSNFASGVHLKAVHQLLFPAGFPQTPVAGAEVQKFPPGHILKEIHFPGDIAQKFLDAVPLLPAIQVGNPALAGLGTEKPHQVADGGGFSGAVGAEKSEDFPLFHPEGNLEDALPVPIVPGQIGNFDHTHCGRLLFSGLEGYYRNCTKLMGFFKTEFDIFIRRWFPA